MIAPRRSIRRSNRIGNRGTRVRRSERIRRRLRDAQPTGIATTAVWAAAAAAAAVRPTDCRFSIFSSTDELEQPLSA